MAISYKKLWKLLIDRDMNRKSDRHNILLVCLMKIRLRIAIL